jgi:lysophospholipase L1-like esterase
VGLLRNLVLAGVSLALFVGAAEGVSRLWFHPATIRYDGLFEYHPVKVFALKPNVVDGSFVGKRVDTNSRGERDREIPMGKPANGLRVLAIGDSVTFGHGVDGEQTWPEELERRLAARFPSRVVDVINTAQPGNSPFQEYVDLERGFELAPDAVVVQFVLNDVVGPRLFLRRYGGKGIDYHGVEDVPYWDWVASQYSAFYLAMKAGFARLRFGALTDDGVRAAAVQEERGLAWEAAADRPQTATIRAAWTECIAWLRREADLCAARGVPMILLATPVDFQFADPSRTWAQQRLARFAAHRGVVFVDLLPALRARAIDGDRAAVWDRYFVDYDHLSPAGHALVAEMLAPEIESIADTRASARR